MVSISRCERDFLEQKKFYFAWEEEKEEKKRVEVLSSILETVKGPDIWEISSLKEKLILALFNVKKYRRATWK